MNHDTPPTQKSEKIHTHARWILLNAHIITMNPRRPKATGMAIAPDGKIMHLADTDSSELAPLRSPSTQIIDLKGRMVVPGFIESHAHLIGIGRMSQLIPLGNATHEDQLTARLEKYLEENKKFLSDSESTREGPAWILGRGWDQNHWTHPVLPSHHSLTRTSPLHPVCFTRVDGHAYWVNQKALDLAGINEKTIDPPGGKIVRDEKNRPTGLLIDWAMDLVDRVRPPRKIEEERLALELGLSECLKHGVTTFHDASSASSSISLYKEFLDEGKLSVRTKVMIDAQETSLLEETLSRGPRQFGQDQLSISAIKLFADGALGSCGALLHDDYEGQCDHKGLALLPEDEIYLVTKKALAQKLQVCTHAIGDKANTLVLNAYERALKETKPEDYRLRVEHAEVLLPTDIPRFARNGIIASMQATHCTSDMPWIEERLGKERSQHRASPWRSLLDSGAIIANGSDAPIESINPIWGLYSSITRQNHEGWPADGWNPEQKMTREEALRSFTLHGAYAAFAEKSTGSLEAGKWADAIVLSQNLFTVAEKEIVDTFVLMTMIGGKIVYHHPHFQF